MSNLGWRAQSSQLSRQAKPIEGLRDDFGVRFKAAIEAVKERGGEPDSQTAERNTGKLNLTQNKGVEARAAKDATHLVSADEKEAARIASLERKAALYERLQGRVDLDDEAANDLHEVDFIAKALNTGDRQPREAAAAPKLQRILIHPEEILKQQRAIKEQMQGGRAAEYSTYEQDMAELQAQHQKVDELDAQNAERNAEFAEAKKRKAAREELKEKESAKHKNAILKQLLKKRQKLK